MLDPSLAEIREALDSSNLELDEFDGAAAIYWFASDYHAGQSSSLYSVLSTSDYRPSPMARSVSHEGDRAIEAYAVLVETFAPSFPTVD